MSFDQANFNKAMDNADSMVRVHQETALDSLKDQFVNMTPGERREAFSQMAQHNQDHATKLTVEGNILGDFEIVGTHNEKHLGGLLGSTEIKYSSR